MTVRFILLQSTKLYATVQAFACSSSMCARWPAECFPRKGVMEFTPYGQRRGCQFAFAAQAQGKNINTLAQEVLQERVAL